MNDIPLNVLVLCADDNSIEAKRCFIFLRPFLEKIRSSLNKYGIIDTYYIGYDIKKYRNKPGFCPSSIEYCIEYGSMSNMKFDVFISEFCPSSSIKSIINAINMLGNDTTYFISTDYGSSYDNLTKKWSETGTVDWNSFEEKTNLELIDSSLVNIFVERYIYLFKTIEKIGSEPVKKKKTKRSNKTKRSKRSLRKK